MRLSHATVSWLLFLIPLRCTLAQAPSATTPASRPATAAPRTLPELKGEMRLAVVEHRNQSGSPSSLTSDQRRVRFRIDRDGLAFQLTHPGGNGLKVQYQPVTHRGQRFALDLYEKVPVQCRVEQFQRTDQEVRVVIAYTGIAQYGFTYTRLRFSGALLLTCKPDGDGYVVMARDRHGYGLDDSMLPMLTRLYTDSGGQLPIASILRTGELTAWEGRAVFRPVKK